MSDGHGLARLVFQVLAEEAEITEEVAFYPHNNMTDLAEELYCKLGQWFAPAPTVDERLLGEREPRDDKRSEDAD